MKRNTLATLLAAACCLVSVAAHAQTAGTNEVLRNGYFFNQSTNQKTDGAGNALTTESVPLSDQGLTFSNIIGPVSLAVAAGDSSAVLDTRRMRLGMLWLKITPSTGTGGVNRLAIQIRGHLNGLSDSSSVGVVYQYTATTSASDTSNTGHLVTGSASVAWSGEQVISADRARNSPGDVVAATAFSYPNMIIIPLQSDAGREHYLPHMSIRVRNLAGPTCTVTAHYTGTPL